MRLRRQQSATVLATPQPERAAVVPSQDRTPHPGGLAILWIRLVNRRPILTHLGSSVLVFLAIQWVVSSLHIAQHEESFIVELVRELLLVLLALAVPVVGTIAALQRPLRSVLRIVGQATSGSGAPVLAFLGDTLFRMQDNLVQLRGEGAVLEPYEVAAWVRRCFKAASGQYVGTDSHRPSLYNELYSDYLAAHEEYLRKTRRRDSVRIMLVDIERLRTDRIDEPAAFNSFVQWHAREGVALLHLPMRENEQIFTATDLGSSLRQYDIGFWEDDFALLFERTDDHGVGSDLRVRIRLAFKGEDLYAKCERYVEELLRVTGYKTPSARDLTAELPIYSGELSRNWKRFCDPEKRLKQTGPFLESVLNRFGNRRSEIRVFDAAAGIGIEAAYLLKAGYFLVANEIEPELRQAAREYAQSVESRIPDALFTRLNWLDLGEGLIPDSFNAVYVIGNSLCHLESLSQVDKALANFYRILSPGGVLICDERNFSYILDNWETLTKDPWNNFRFNKRRRTVMYHGRGVMGAPIERRRDRVIFQYADVRRDPQRGSITVKSPVGELSMLPFRKDELRNRLLRAGFVDLEVYCDLQRAPGGECDDEADFFTYVAVKPVSEEDGGATDAERETSNPVLAEA